MVFLMRKIQVIIVLAVAVAAAWLTTRLDGGMGIAWTQNVVRNWEQFGFFNLHGQMVVNSGGFAANTKPEIYPGHRAASLYPVFVCHHLLAATGLGFTAYYAFAAAMVLVAIWWMLGRTERAFWLAAMSVLAPGYLRWQTSLDPNLVANLFGFLFCAAVLALVRRPSLSWPQAGVLLALTLVYSAINWTTVFCHAMLLVTLLVLPTVPRRNLLIYAGLMAVAGGAVLLTSLASKMTGADGHSAGLAHMLRGYGWGNAGYGVGLSTKTAILRLLAANVIGLLPVLVYLGWQFFRRGGRVAANRLVFLLPLAMAVMEILGMRNYFGHHPWMSVNFILLGLMLSAVAWKDRAGAAAAPSRTRLPVRLAWLAAVFVYGFAVQTIAHVNSGAELSLVAFIREHTARDTTIIIRRDTDPALADTAPRLSELFDRHLVVVPDLGENNLAGVPVKRAILTAAVQPPEKVLARMTGTDDTAPVMKALLGWYASHIAQRRAGDKLEFGEQYFLCQQAN
jgi:hypothetical protein